MFFQKNNKKKYFWSFYIFKHDIENTTSTISVREPYYHFWSYMFWENLLDS